MGHQRRSSQALQKTYAAFDKTIADNAFSSPSCCCDGESSAATMSPNSKQYFADSSWNCCWLVVERRAHLKKTYRDHRGCGFGATKWPSLRRASPVSTGRIARSGDRLGLSIPVGAV